MPFATSRARLLSSLLGPMLPLVVLIVLPVGITWSHHPMVPGQRSGPHGLLAIGIGLLLVATASGGLDRLLRRRLQQGVFVLTALTVATLQRHLAVNELAGVLVLLIPLPLALAVGPGRAAPGLEQRPLPVGRWAPTLLTLLLAASLLHGQSRSGLGALALVTGPLLLLLGGRGRRLLAALTVVGLLLLPVVGIDTLLELMVYDQKIQRLDLFSFLTGRPHIWHRAVLALGDLGTVGAGLATAGPLTAAVYPYSRLSPGEAFEDVHNLYLQTALDLGLPGALAFFSLIALALFRLGRAALRGPEKERPWVLGLAAGLVAHLLYSLFDSVALGAPGSLVTWFALGLACSTGADHHLRTDRSTPEAEPIAHRLCMLLPVVLPLALWALRPGLPPLGYNLASLDACRALTIEQSRARVTRQRLLEVDTAPCRAHWLAGQLAATAGDRMLRDADWNRLFTCSASFIELVEAEAPEDLALARSAVARQPTAAAAHRYLARMLLVSRSVMAPGAGGLPGGTSGANPPPTPGLFERFGEQAIARYRHALALEPRNGRAWLELGQLLYQEHPRAALQAWIEVCEQGDYRGQGCIKAGAMALRLDDLPTAVSYYRKSRMPGARQYGDFLALGPENEATKPQHRRSPPPRPPG